MMRRAIRTGVPSVVIAAAVAAATSPATADVTVFKSDEGWQLYVSGRVSAFASWHQGDGVPGALGPWELRGDGVKVGTGLYKPPAPPPDPAMPTPPVQGEIRSMRVRSGFVSNVFGFGIKRPFGQASTVTGFTSIWGAIEPNNHRKYETLYAEFREGYLKAEGKWGGVQAGRFFGLFSREITNISYDYGHAYAVGSPFGAVDRAGPTAGHIGFGVLAAGFAPGVVYSTPMVGGFQLTAGFFEPAVLAGSKWERPSVIPRPEAEATFERPIGSKVKFKLFANGAWQKLEERDGSLETTAYGVGYGGRLEVGPVHVGGGGHMGRGLGTNFAFEPSPVTYSEAATGNELRPSRGIFLQGQLALGKVDINAGYGHTQVDSLASDDNVDPNTMQVAISVINWQSGISGVIVYHAAPFLHFAVDFFRAQYRWRMGEQQTLNFFSLGTTLIW
jgi:hypothetical protein